MTTGTLSRYVETRGTLWTATSGGHPVALHAWFRLSDDGSRVIARRVRGRRTWFYARPADVVRFVPGASA